MGNINLLAVALGAVAFFMVGMVWYTVLFGKAWQKATGLTQEQMSGANMPLIFGLSFLLELLISLTLGHQIAMTQPSDRVIMMMSTGFALGIMIPAIGINYLYLRKTLAHFLIDAGHFLVGMAAMGAVFVALG